MTSIKSRIRSTVKKVTASKKQEANAVEVSKPMGAQRTLTLTESNIKNGKLNLSSIISFFPASSLGGPSVEAGVGKPVTLYATGLDQAIKTDIAKDKKIFRSRALLGFYRANRLNAGDRVTLWRVSADRYVIHPTVG